MDSSIKFNVSANTAQFQSGMSQVDAAAKSTAAGIKQAFSGLGSLLAGGAVLGGLKTIMDDFDRVAKLATRFGASAEDIQRVSVASDLAGVSIDTVARVLTKMSVAASDAGTGSKEMAEAFERAGINAEQFKNAGLEEQLIMLSEAFNRARGDADATNQIIELMGTRAAAQMIPLIDNTAALREEMAGVSVASDETVRRIEAANDRMTRFFNDLKVAGAGAIGFITDTAERFGSLLGGAGFKTIKELEEIELRANAINQLTREGLLGGNDAENARLIAERMEQIRKKLEGNKTIVSDINDDLVQANALEKEKTSELERQQRLLEQQEAKRKDAIKDAQFEVDLIEAKLRGDKARVAALEEQRDFEQALEKTGSTEVAASLAAAKAAQRAADQARDGTSAAARDGTSAAAGSSPQTALDRLRAAAAGMDVDAMTAESRIEARGSRGEARAQELEAAGLHRAAAQIRAREQRNAERRAQEFEARQRNRRRQKELQDMGLLDRANAQSEDRKLAREQERMAREQSKTESERERLAESSPSGGGGGGGAARGTDDLATESTLKQILEKIQERPILVA